jgi:hypothetical protein
LEPPEFVDHAVEVDKVIHNSTMTYYYHGFSIGIGAWELVACGKLERALPIGYLKPDSLCAKRAGFS